MLSNQRIDDSRTALERLSNGSGGLLAADCNCKVHNNAEDKKWSHVDGIQAYIPQVTALWRLSDGSLTAL
jgi:hypothetical protein